MIEVRFNSRPLYANVYIHTKGQLTYHVNFIGDDLPGFLLDTIILSYRDEKLAASDEGLPPVIIKKIVEQIEKHLS